MSRANVVDIKTGRPPRAGALTQSGGFTAGQMQTVLEQIAYDQDLPPEDATRRLRV